MAWHQRPVPWFLKGVLCVPVAMAVLFVAPAAKTETESANKPNPDNVLVLQRSSAPTFGRWVGPPAAAAATRTVRTQRVRISKPKKRSEPVAAQSTPAEPRAAQSEWPNAAATVGAAAFVPLEVKTIREMVAPDPQVSFVFENELSDIDLAARPLLLASPRSILPASTDGRSHPDSDDARMSEQPRVFAMADSVRSITQSAWFEPLLLALAGALAAISAVRLFA